MTDTVLEATDLGGAAAPTRTALFRRLRATDVVFRTFTHASAIGVLLILGAVIVSLVSGSLPALRAFGVSFLYTEVWNPVTEKFGALAPIYGTLVTSIIAMMIAVPLGLMIAMFLTEICPRWLRRPLSFSPASPVSSMASGACSYSPRSCSTRCSRR